MKATAASPTAVGRSSIRPVAQSRPRNQGIALVSAGSTAASATPRCRRSGRARVPPVEPCSRPIGRALGAETPPIQDVRVDHRWLHRLVPEEPGPSGCRGRPGGGGWRSGAGGSGASSLRRVAGASVASLSNLTPGRKPPPRPSRSRFRRQTREEEGLEDEFDEKVGSKTLWKTISQKNSRSRRNPCLLPARR